MVTVGRALWDEDDIFAVEVEVDEEEDDDDDEDEEAEADMEKWRLKKCTQTPFSVPALCGGQ